MKRRMENKILVINTGSTSTKIAFYKGDNEIYSRNLPHPAETLKQFETLNDQLPYRKQKITEALEEDKINLDGTDAVAARGGTFGIVNGGAYLVEENLLKACKNPVTNHPSNLSAVLGYEFAEELGCKAYIYDAVCTCEVPDLARMTGLHDVFRRPFSHVLNTRAVAREQARRMGKRYEDMNFIVAHLGGGISINVHVKGKIIDIITDDEGPMSPERAGGLNGKALIDLCFSGEYDEQSMLRRIKGRGGLVDYLGTSDLRKVEQMIQEGNTTAEKILEAMAYQIAKGIASLSAVTYGRIDQIILTGGGAYCSRLTGRITERVSFIAPVEVFPGAMEMEALASGIGRVLDGTEMAQIYQRKGE